MFLIQNITIQSLDNQLTVLLRVNKVENILENISTLETNFNQTYWKTHAPKEPLLEFSIDPQPKYYFERIDGILSRLTSHNLLDPNIWAVIKPKLRKADFKGLAQSNTELNLYTAMPVASEENSGVSMTKMNVEILGMTSGSVLVNSSSTHHSVFFKGVNAEVITLTDDFDWRNLTPQ